MVPHGRMRTSETLAARSVQMALKRKFPALSTRLECRSRDQTRHRTSNFRTVRSSEGKSAGSCSNYIRRADHNARQRRPSRTPEFWSFSNQTKSRSGRQESSDGGCRQRPTSLFCKFQARQGNGCAGKRARRAAIFLNLSIYHAELGTIKSLDTTYISQPNRFRYENFYHRTGMLCSVHSQRNILGKSSHWAENSHQSVADRFRVQGIDSYKTFVQLTETRNITDTGSMAR